MAGAKLTFWGAAGQVTGSMHLLEAAGARVFELERVWNHLNDSVAVCAGGGLAAGNNSFAALTERLWNEVRPLYEELHCFTRAGLNRTYGDSVQPATGPIRADLLGNLWAQEWGNVYDVVAPRTSGA